LQGSTSFSIYGIGSTTMIMPNNQISFVAGQTSLTLQVVNR
jgi:hypothetical protein